MDLHGTWCLRCLFAKSLASNIHSSALAYAAAIPRVLRSGFAENAMDDCHGQNLVRSDLE